MLDDGRHFQAEMIPLKQAGAPISARISLRNQVGGGLGAASCNANQKYSSIRQGLNAQPHARHQILRNYPVHYKDL